MKKIAIILCALFLVFGMNIPAEAEEPHNEHEYDENGFCVKSASCEAYQAAKFVNSEDGEYYEISNAGQLYWLAEHINKDIENNNAVNAKLTKDIVVNEDGVETKRPWKEIQSYAGSFDGQGNSIKGLYSNYSPKAGAYSCFITTIESGGSVTNLELVNVSFRSWANNSGYGIIDACYTGGICYTNNGTISNCSVSGTLSAVLGKVAAISSVNNGVISDCTSTADVAVDAGEQGVYAAGICGVNSDSGRIENCTNAGVVTADGSETAFVDDYYAYGGGVCAVNNGTISDCRHSGGVSTNSYGYVGGIVYSNESPAIIIGCEYAPAEEETQKAAVKVYTNNGIIIETHTHTYEEEGNDSNGICEVPYCYQPYEAAKSVEEAGKKVYQIANAGNLYWFAGLVNGSGDVCQTYDYYYEYEEKTYTCDVVQDTSANAKLTTDIIVNEEDVAEKRAWKEILSYAGSFDGAGFSIKGLYSNYSYVQGAHSCFITTIEEGGSVTNLNLENVSFSSYANNSGTGATGVCYTGGICYTNNGTISGCSVSGTLSAKFGSVAAISSENNGIVRNCTSTAAVSVSAGERHVFAAGICGVNSDSGTIESCENAGVVTADGSKTGFGYDFNAYGGGVCADNDGEINDCSHSGSVSANSYGYAGGIVYSNAGLLAECISSGSVDDAGVCYENESNATIIGCEYAPAEEATQKAAVKVYTNDGSVIETHIHTYDEEGNTSNGICEELYCAHPYEVPEVVEEAGKKVYQIANAGNLYWFAGLVNGSSDVCQTYNYEYEEKTYTYEVVQDAAANAVLLNDVTVNEKVLKRHEDNSLFVNADDMGELQDRTGLKELKAWIPMDSYAGTFDGRNYAVKGLYYDGSNMGTFIKTITQSATVKNVSLEDTYFVSTSSVAGICETNEGMIDGSSVEGYLYGEYSTGGICYTNEGIISGCRSNAVLYIRPSGTPSGGGICAINDGTVSDSTNYGKIITVSRVNGGNWYYVYTGGICGTNKATGSIIDCTNAGDIKAAQWAGGIVCRNMGKVEASTNTAAITAEYVGGVAYENQSGAYLVGCEYAPAEDVTQKATVKVYTNSGAVIEIHMHTYEEDGNASNGICEVPYCSQPYEKPDIDNAVYQIANAGNLYWFAGLVNGSSDVCQTYNYEYKGETYACDVVQDRAANAVLLNDITVNEKVLKRNEDNSLFVNANDMGELQDRTGLKELKAWTPMVDYEGTFDGKNYAVKGLYCDEDYATFIEYMTASATVKNVRLEDIYFVNYNYAAGICGVRNDGKIDGCSVEGYISGRYPGGIVCVNNNSVENCMNDALIYVGRYNGSIDYIGGICYTNRNVGTISKCQNNGKVIGDPDASGYRYGGICGKNEGTIEDCSNTGEVKTHSAVAGGIAGENKGTISGASNYGEVRGNTVGGIAGNNYLTITLSTNSGMVNGSYAGGICGYSYAGSHISNSMNTGTVKCNGYNLGGICGNVYETTTIQYCGNTGELLPSRYTDAGGIVGRNSARGCTITGCYNTGIIKNESDSDTSCFGALVGSLGSTTITDCYYLNENNAIYTENGEAKSCTITAFGYNTVDTEGSVGMAKTDFANGKVAYLLQSINADAGKWGQNLDLDGQDVQQVPSINGGVIYTYDIKGCDGTTTKVGYSNNENHAQVTEEHLDANRNGGCDTCGHIMDGISSLAKYTVSFADSIGLNFYMKLENSDNVAKMVFTINGRTIEVALSEAELKDGYYKFTCPVYATEMTSEVIGTIVCVDGTPSGSHTYSVRQYADVILQNVDNLEDYTNAQAVVKAMLKYGSEVQKVKNKYTDKLADMDLDLSITSQVSHFNAESPYAWKAEYVTGSLPTGISYVYTTMVFDSTTNIRHYFKLSEGTEIPEGFVKKGDMYYVEVNGFYANKLGEKKTTTIENWQINYCPLNYAWLIITKNVDANYNNTMCALLDYYQAAVRYNETLNVN